MRQLNSKLLLGAGIILIASFSYLFYNYSQEKTSPKSKALAISAQCKNTKSDRCYVKEFAQIAQQNDLSHTLSVLSELQRTDPSVAGCHFIAHVVASEEVNKNPQEWQKLMSRIPIDDCTGGYLMGVMEGRSKFEKNFKVNSTTVQQLCNEVRHAARKNVDQTCFHIMGHLLLIETDGNLPQAIEICNNLSEEFRYECYAGVFMENEYKRNLSAHGIGKPAKWDSDMMKLHKKICNEYKGAAAEACWREISHVFNFIYKNYPPDVYTACSEAPTANSKEECYIHAVGVMSISARFDHKHFNLLCQPYEGNDPRYQRCARMVINTLKQSSSTNTALQKFCSTLQQKHKSFCAK